MFMFTVHFIACFHSVVKHLHVVHFIVCQHLYPPPPYTLGKRIILIIYTYIYLNI